MSHHASGPDFGFPRAAQVRRGLLSARKTDCNGSVVVAPGGFTPKDMRTFKISTDLAGQPADDER